MFHGSMVALVTPMTKEGDIDYACLSELVEWHIDAGTQAIIAAGTTGESGTLTHQEKVHVIKHIVKQTHERIPVIAGTSANATQEAITLTTEAMHAGADAVLLMTPAYVKPTQEGLYQHYRAIAEAVVIPQILYNVPSRTACDLLPETVERLTAIPNIIGIKEATGSLNRLMTILERCGDRIDIYSGDDFTAKDLMLIGAKGIISVTANVAPHEMRKLCDAAVAGNRAQADALNAKLEPLHKALFVESNPIPTKWALHQMGKIPEGIRLPLTPLSQQYHQTVLFALEAAGIRVA